MIFDFYYLFSRNLQGEGAVTEESARIMLKRGLKQSGDGFVFTRDLRHKVPSLYGFTEEYLEEFAKNLSCPHLLIKVVRRSLGKGEGDGWNQH